jgi:heat shock protein HslJ
MEMGMAKLLAGAFFGLVCLAGPAFAHAEKLEGSEWSVVGDTGESARFVSFAGSGRIFGFAGCNRFSGTYEQHDEHLTIAPLATTRKMCPPDMMARETEFLDLLAKVRGVRVDHTLLLFLDEQGGDLRALLRKDVE